MTGLSSEPARWSCDKCQRMSDLTVVNLMILIRMGNITDRLVSSCARSIVTFDIGLHEVCVRVGGRTLRHNRIFSDG